MRLKPTLEIIHTPEYGPFLQLLLGTAPIDRRVDVPVELDADGRMDAVTFAVILRSLCAATDRFIKQNDPIA